MNEDIVTVTPYLNSIAKYYTKDQNDAKDLVQETVLKAITKSHQFRPGTSLKNWTATIMRNTFINRYRRKKKMNTTDLFEDVENSQSIRNEGEFNFFQKELNQVIGKLKEEHQELIKLRQEGYSYQELAEILNKPVGTIKSQLFFARKQVKEALENINLI